MAKRVDTPKDWKRFTGYVEFRDPLPLSAVLAWEDAVAEIAELQDKKTVTRMNTAMLPCILQCVETWHIDGVPEQPTLDTFPGTPRIDSAKLIGWLSNNISIIYVGEGLTEPDPNE